MASNLTKALTLTVYMAFPAVAAAQVPGVGPGHCVANCPGASPPPAPYRPPPPRPYYNNSGGYSGGGGSASADPAYEAATALNNRAAAMHLNIPKNCTNAPAFRAMLHRKIAVFRQAMRVQASRTIRANLLIAEADLDSWSPGSCGSDVPAQIASLRSAIRKMRLACSIARCPAGEIATWSAVLSKVAAREMRDAPRNNDDPDKKKDQGPVVAKRDDKSKPTTCAECNKRFRVNLQNAVHDVRQGNVRVHVSGALSQWQDCAKKRAGGACPVPRLWSSVNKGCANPEIDTKACVEDILKFTKD